MPMAGLPWPGGGPWLISPECLAPKHNSLRAARGVRYVRTSGQRIGVRVHNCICPRAEVVRIADNASRRERRKELGSTPIVSEPVSNARMPDMSDAACRHPINLVIFDELFDANGSAQTRATRQAKEVCASCPLRDVACAPYVLAKERPAGAWRGVWGGMSPADRRRVASEAAVR